MKNKKIFFIGFILIILFFNVLFTCVSQAELENDIQYIALDDENITVNNEEITTNTAETIYLTNAMDNGGNSDEAKNANVKIANIININKSGTYELTGKLSDGQIAINTNDIQGNVTIILNNVDITCENAPAIFVYNSNNDSNTCTVTIELAEGSTNTIAGGKLKQSVEGWENQEELLYYIDKGYDDEGTYYERYKYDAAISSDISLTFDGRGTLTINSLAKEGVESKRDITINNGNYIINSLDDGINACTDRESIITINGGNILVDVSDEAEEGDGIDSNGYIYINGGYVYAFASEISQDSGLDSDLGIYINGGYVVGTGNMADEISTNAQQNYMQMQFTTKVNSGDLITITDESKNPIVAFKTDKSYSVITVSTPELQDGEHYVYEGGEIEGKSENGLYTEITSYEEGTIKEYNNTENGIRPNDFRPIENNQMLEEKNNNIYFYVMSGLGILLILLVILAIILVKKEKINIKGNILILIIGIILGSIITIGVFYIMNNNETDDATNTMQQQNQFNLQHERPEMPTQDMQGENGMNQMERPEDMANPNNGNTMQPPEMQSEQQVQ